MELSYWYLKWWVKTRITHPLRAKFGRTYRTSKSGQLTKRHGYIEVKGDRRLFTLPFVDGQIQYTLDELRGMTATCAWCGKPIFIGDMITLYGTSREGNLKVKEGATLYALLPTALWVGCNRDSCTDTVADWQGRWVPDETTFGKGQVERMMSPLELMLQNPGAAVHIVQDCGEVSMKLIR